jgi:hypothetical protein
LTPARTRRTLRSIAATGALASMLVASSAALGAASAGAAVHPHLAVAADPLTVHVGSPIVVSGTASPQAAIRVYLQRYVAGQWKNLTHQTTTKAGGYAFSVKAPGKPTTWIFRVARAGTTTASHTVHVQVSASSFHVKATTTTSVPAGNPVVFVGSVSPKATGAVRLQILHGKVWTNLAAAKLTTRSTFILTANRPAGAYRLRVIKPFTAKIAGGVSPAQWVAVLSPIAVPTPTNPVSPGSSLHVSSPDDPLLALSATRMVFSAVQGQALPAAKSFTLTNSGTAAATVSGLTIAGTDASSYGLAAGQPSTITVPAGGSATVSIQFHPTAPTGCPTTADPYGVSGSNRNAALVFSTSDPAMPTGSANLAGLISCGLGGNNEPVLHQIVQALGYSTVVDTPTDQRFLKMQSIYPGTDEVGSPYFRVADPSAAVSVTALAHYSSASTTPYQTNGWYAKGATLPTDGSCNTSCRPLWQFPADPSLTTYNQNQKLLPTTVPLGTAQPTGVFGLYAGDGTEVVFSDDSLNAASAPHDMRIYPAYGPSHVAIPNTYLVAIDTGRASEDKNGDYQDVVLIVRNVMPAT